MSLLSRTNLKRSLNVHVSSRPGEYTRPAHTTILTLSSVFSSLSRAKQASSVQQWQMENITKAYEFDRPHWTLLKWAANCSLPSLDQKIQCCY